MRKGVIVASIFNVNGNQFYFCFKIKIETILTTSKILK